MSATRGTNDQASPNSHGTSGGLKRWWRTLGMRLFVSFAHEDEALAERCTLLLTEEGFQVFLANHAIRLGEPFPPALARAVARSHAVVALVSRHFVDSRWCLAELHRAHGLGIPIIPFQVQVPSPTPPAVMQVLFESIQSVNASTEPELAAACRRLMADSQSLRRQRRKRLAWFAGVSLIFVGAALAGGLGYRSVLQHTATAEMARRTEEYMTQARNSTKLFADSQVTRTAEDLVHFPPFLQACAELAADPNASPTARFNALLAGSKVAGLRHTPDRLVINSADWSHATLTGAHVSKISLLSGSLSRLEFEQCSLADVLWGGPESHPKLRLGEVVFDRCSLYGNNFENAVLNWTTIRNSKLIGCTLDVTKCTRLVLELNSRVNDPNTVTDELMEMQGCLIRNGSVKQEPQANQLDFTDPAKDFLFREVLFRQCHFRGWMPEVCFERCTFEDCVFDNAQSESRLRQDTSGHQFIEPITQ